MENPFKSIGFRNFVIKLAMWIVIGLGISILISIFFKYTPLFTKYLDIPSVFSENLSIYRGTIINACLFGIVGFVIFSYKKLTRIKNFKFKKSQLWFALLAILVLVGEYIFKYLINMKLSYFMQSPIFWGYVKFAFVPLFAFLLYLAVFGIDFTKYFIKEYGKELILFIIITIVFFFVTLLVQSLWTYFSNIVSHILFWTFSLFFKNVTYQPYVTSFTMSEGGGPLLGINSFKAVIGQPCSGIDSFLLFTSLYALIFMLDYKRLKKGLAIGLFFVGVVGMFLTNVLRILLLFIVGAYIDANFAIGLFHTNAGWILFIVYFFVFWLIVSRYIYKDKKPLKK